MEPKAPTKVASFVKSWMRRSHFVIMIKYAMKEDILFSTEISVKVVYFLISRVAIKWGASTWVDWINYSIMEVSSQIWGRGKYLSLGTREKNSKIVGTFLEGVLGKSIFEWINEGNTDVNQEKLCIWPIWIIQERRTTWIAGWIPSIMYGNLGFGRSFLGKVWWSLLGWPSRLKVNKKLVWTYLS